MTDRSISNKVSVYKGEASYPQFPYPDESGVQEALLGALSGLGLDRGNPFKSYVGAGQKVVVKPNWVRESNPLGHSVESLLTHTSLIYYVVDLLGVAMKGEGTVLIADAPLQKCNFDKLRENTGIDLAVGKLKEKYPRLKIELRDWRITTLERYDTKSANPQSHRLAEKVEDSEEYEVVDLGQDSFLEEISEHSHKFRVTNYKPSLMQKRHSKGKHQYAVAKDIVDADFIVNMPKMKTHMKAGLTCALKNLIGINGHKEFLPHHIKGSYFEGGDNYLMPNFFRAKYEDLYDYVWEDINRFSVRKRNFLLKVLKYLSRLSVIFGKESIAAGSWRGNDTVWRTTLDLNHIAYFYPDKSPKILNIVDGIIAGEKQGPMKPVPKPLGVVIAGENPAYVDAVVAKMMGYTVARVPTVYNAVYNRRSKFGGELLENFKVRWSSGESEREIAFDSVDNYNFEKPEYWEGV